VARNRQRAKERQARRKQQGGGAGAAAPEPARAEAQPQPEPQAPQPDEPVNGSEALSFEEAHLRAGAPAEDLGRSDETLDYEQDVDAEEDLGEDHYDPALDQAEDDIPATTGPRGHRGSEADHKHRPRLVQFFYAVVAELRRVQWPDRQALTTLTGVVLGFVLIAGGYLGLLDAIFSRLVQSIL
jgi:preprotein translocase subunit SecE